MDTYTDTDRRKTATHYLFEKRVQIYRRNGSRVWQCAARVNGQRFRESTKEQDLDRAKDVAEEWYLDLRGKTRRGEIIRKEKSFRDAADDYVRKARTLTHQRRSETYVELVILRLNRHILPFCGDMALSDINKGLAERYCVHRTEETMERTRTENGPGKPPARSTLLQEVVILRQVLKHAESEGWIPFVPSLSTPFLRSTKRNRRAWFSPEEYKQLYTATRRRITKGKRRGWKKHYEEMHDFVLFMANTGLRPDEAKTLEFRDVSIEEDAATGETILVLDVRGKTGVRFAKSMPGAVLPFKRLKARRRAELIAAGCDKAELQHVMQRTKVFAPYNRDLFNAVLKDEGLKSDRDGKRRTAYSLRHTYVSLRLLEGANIHMLANNCGTSVEMIEAHYAAHIKDRIDAAAINTKRPQSARKPRRKATMQDK